MMKFIAVIDLPEMVLVCAIVILGLLFLLSLASNYIKATKQKQRSELAAKVHEARNHELQWYREKRFLMERQAKEKHDRLRALIIEFKPENKHDFTGVGSWLFHLSESIREERQHLGTDLSKLAVLDQRMDRLGKEFVVQSSKTEEAQVWIEQMEDCRDQIAYSREKLKEAQSQMRTVFNEIIELETKVRQNSLSTDDLSQVRAQLVEARKQVTQLPEGIRTVAKSAGERAQAIFGESTRHLPKQELHSIWKEQLMMDLFSSKHRSGGRADLRKSVELALESLDSVAPEEERVKVLVDRQHKADSAIDVKCVDEINADLSPQWGPPSFSDIAPSDTSNMAEASTQEVSVPITVEAQVEAPTTSATSIGAAAAASVVVGADKISRPNAEEVQDQAAMQDQAVDKEGYQFKGKPDPVESVDITPPPAQVNEVLVQNPWQEPNNPFSEIKPCVTEGSDLFTTQAMAVEKQVTEVPASEHDSERLIIFRSNDPEIWNTTCDRGDNHRSIALNEISGESNWLGIKRTDTNEEIFIPISQSELRSSGDGNFGFNGSNEFFYGARHLGLFSDHCETDVETRFTYGGWGFGHSSSNDSNEPVQLCAWNGQRIADDTVFEIALYEGRPSEARDELVVNG